MSYITAIGIKYAFKNIKEIVSDEQKSFYLKNFIILLIQYLIIILVTFLGFYYDFNISLLNLITHIISIILQLGIITFFEINILSFLLENKGFAIIFNICFPFIASYYNFLLFSIIEYKYIIIGLSFILIEVISIFLNAIFSENFKNINLFIISSSLNLISLILFSVLWMKDIFIEKH